MIQILKNNFLNHYNAPRSKTRAIQAAISASVQHNPTYSLELELNEKANIRKAWENNLIEIGELFTENRNLEFYLETVHKFQLKMSEFNSLLSPNNENYANGFRIAHSQKSISVYLKHLWCMDLIPEPPCCPVDRIIVNAADVKLIENWTQMNTIKSLAFALNEFTRIANHGNISIAAWELQLFPISNQKTLTKETLTELGFIKMGYWILDENKTIITPRYTKPELKITLNTLYAFTYETSNDEIILGYIGKTTKSIDSRFMGYIKPGSGQKTNIRINQKIKEKLNLGLLVEIFALPDITPLQWQGYNLNIAAGIEDSLINGLRPEWNLHGTNNSNKILNTQEEIESMIESEINLKVPPTSTPNKLETNNFEPNNDNPVYFRVKLGNTYFYEPQGYMNPGVQASMYLGNYGDNATLFLNNNLVLESSIDRIANLNGSVRFYWGIELINFYQTNFNFNDTLLFKVNDKNKISFVERL